MSDLDIYIPEKISRILNKIEQAGYDAYYVGGCVRDSILGRTPSDYDISTSASPDAIKTIFDGSEDFDIAETGIKHGTVTVSCDGECAEVTTFRIDGEYIDHRRPSSVTFSENLVDDLSRRDFTINAMAYNPRTGLVDKFGGQKDLFKHKITCVGEPAVRFNEDALRIMRAMRFASVLNFRIDDITAVAMHDLRRLLQNISAERITKELDLILTGSAPAEVMTEFSDVFAIIIPEIKPSIGFDQHSRYHAYDVWTHTAYAVEHSLADRDVRLALLLHDIAKPVCCRLDEEGVGHFKNHERAGAEMALAILHRLKYPNDVAERISQLIKYHYVTPIDDKNVVTELLAVLGEDDFFKLTEMMKGDSRAKQSFCFERVDVLKKMQEKAREIIENNDCYTLAQLAVNGNDIISLGASGKKIGTVLNALLEEVIGGKVGNNRDELLKCAEKMLE